MRETVPSAWRTAVLVCGKCSKRVGGGFGAKGRMPLAKALRKLMPKGKKRRQPYGVTEISCLGLCPKRAVVVVDARRPGEWLLVRPGTPVEAVAARLGVDEPISDRSCRAADGDTPV